MSKVIEIDWRPDDQKLRQFGWVALVGFGFVASLAWFEWLIFAFGLGEARVPVSASFLGLGVLSAFLGLVYPRANLPIYVGLTVLSYPIGFVLSYVIMGSLFYGLLSPVGLFFRVIGRDSMNRKFDPAAETYWTKAKPERPRESYFRQF